MIISLLSTLKKRHLRWIKVKFLEIKNRFFFDAPQTPLKFRKNRLLEKSLPEKVFEPFPRKSSLVITCCLFGLSRQDSEFNPVEREKKKRSANVVIRNDTTCPVPLHSNGSSTTRVKSSNVLLDYVHSPFVPVACQSAPMAAPRSRNTKSVILLVQGLDEEVRPMPQWEFWCSFDTPRNSSDNGSRPEGVSAFPQTAHAVLDVLIHAVALCVKHIHNYWPVGVSAVLAP